MAWETKIIFESSSGNVFTDLNLPNADDKQTKIRLIVIINRIIEERGMTQAQAAEALSIKQFKISALQGYKLGSFSVERLVCFVRFLEHDDWLRGRKMPTEESRARALRLLEEGGNNPPSPGDELPGGYGSSAADIARPARKRGA